jgi:hypothetical protein
MEFKGLNYKRAIEDLFTIIDKESKIVPFKLNPIQEKYLLEDATGRDVILKARQQGFSSVILAVFTLDFLLKENTRSVIVADKADNASELLDRVKFYIKSFEDKTGAKVPMKYNSKYELYNESNGSRYTIGTAENKEIGRSKTITNLHLSEFFFYPSPEGLFAGIMQGVVPGGKVIIESTANGFNYGKEFWDACVLGERPFNPLFYKASDFYSPEFLENKKRELGRLFDQEYPESAETAFLTSGSLYFNSEALKDYLVNIKEPIREGLYV